MQLTDILIIVVLIVAIIGFVIVFRISKKKAAERAERMAKIEYKSADSDGGKSTLTYVQQTGMGGIMKGWGLFLGVTGSVGAVLLSGGFSKFDLITFVSIEISVLTLALIVYALGVIIDLLQYRK